MPPKTMRGKNKTSKRPRLVTDMISDEMQSPSGSSPAYQLVVDTSEEESSFSGASDSRQQPALHHEFRHGRRPSLMNIIPIVQNIEQDIEHFLKLQCGNRQQLYSNFSEQFLNLVVMWNIDAEQAKKHGEKLASILDEQQKLLEQFESFQKQKIKEFKDLCEKYLKSLENIGNCHSNMIAAELRIQMVILEKKIAIGNEESAKARQNFLSLLFS